LLLVTPLSSFILGISTRLGRSPDRVASVK
jgi:hypothetical protein